MKVKFAALLTALLLASVSLPAALLLPRQTVQGKGITSSDSAAVQGYVVRACGGKVAIYAVSGDTPLEVLNVYVDTLPQAEQQKLQKGIHVRTRQELLALEENYTS